MDTQHTIPGLAEQYADIFFQLWRYGLSYLPSMSDRMAEHYGRSMGHYGRIVLAEREAEQQQRNLWHQEELARITATLPEAWKPFFVGGHLGGVEG